MTMRSKCLAWICKADVAGCSRLMAADEKGRTRVFKLTPISPMSRICDDVHARFC
jgi:hypothetical protein